MPATATSGIYIARPVRSDNGGASHIPFVVRDDASHSDIVMQTSDTTWQAYNTYGGNSLYTGQPAGRAYKVSYNRPFNTRGNDNGQDWLFNAEYPMVRWVERNGYDVSYLSGVDSDRSGSAASPSTRRSCPSATTSTGPARSGPTSRRPATPASTSRSSPATRCSGRRGGSPASTAPTRHTGPWSATRRPTRTPRSTRHPAWTGTWRDPRFSPPADGGRPENGLTGTIFTVNDGATTSIQVPEADGKMRLWRGTSVANLAAGATATLPNGTLGYEWDSDLDNGARPAGLVRMSSTTVNAPSVLQDYGSTYGSGTATHNLTLYRRANGGGLVFGAGTVQWSWGLDATHDRGSTATSTPMQQATVNLFADMGAQPATIASGLTAATASTDTTAPTATITSPTAGAVIAPGSAVTITGTATDTGGRVGGVEVSTDNGATWHPGDRPGHVDLRLDRRRQPARSPSRRGRSTTARTCRARPPRSRSTSGPGRRRRRRRG